MLLLHVLLHILFIDGFIVLFVPGVIKAYILIITVHSGGGNNFYFGPVPVPVGFVPFLVRWKKPVPVGSYSISIL